MFNVAPANFSIDNFGGFPSNKNFFFFDMNAKIVDIKNQREGTNGKNTKY